MGYDNLNIRCIAMRKEIKKIGVLLTVVILLTGCMDYRTSMKINNDKSLSLDMSYQINLLEMMNKITDKESGAAIQEQIKKSMCSSFCTDEACINECLESSDDNISSDEIPTKEEIKQYLDEYLNSEEFDFNNFLPEETKKQLESDGFEITENIDKKNYIYTCYFQKKITSIDEVSSSNNITVNLVSILEGTKVNEFFTKKGDTYEANFTWASDTNSNEGTFDLIDIKELQGYITYNYEVTLPNKPIKHNANKVSEDGKTLTWELTNTSDNNINYSFSFKTSEDKPKEETKNNENKSKEILTEENQKLLAIGLIAGGSLTIIITLIAYNIAKKKSL